MAKLTLTLIPILALFLLFSLSHSLQPADLPDLNGHDVLSLPSDIPRRHVPDTDSLAAVANPKSTIAKPDLPEGFTTVPLNKLDFREGNIPLSLRFPHRLRGCRHGFMRRHGMLPREVPYGNDMILSEEKLRPEEFVGKSRFHWVNRRPMFEVAAPWNGEEDVFKMPKKFERGYDAEDMFNRPKKFWHHDEDDDVIKRPKKFDQDDDNHMFEMVEKFKHHDDDDEHMFRMPRKFKHHHHDDDDDWPGERDHHLRFGHHHHKHHHDDDEEDKAHKHGKRHHHEDDDDDDDEAGILSKMRKFFDDLF